MAPGNGALPVDVAPASVAPAAHLAAPALTVRAPLDVTGAAAWLGSLAASSGLARSWAGLLGELAVFYAC